ncbi:trefoil factor 1 [Antechinus flavipes]|uniref:trefoil factor 1 n=1 Tax=Antechinus flavipes TaxID=38775 RepID=UPI0022365DB2|nr:trefoil factor 1 [Antechinus flavipes]
MEYKVFCTLIITLMLGYNVLTQGVFETCNMTPQERKNCGWSGITEKECQERNCCFDSNIRGYPWCFSPRQEIEDNEC